MLLTIADPGSTADTINAISDALKGGHWALAVAFIVMLATRLVQWAIQLKWEFPKKAAPWLAAGLAMVLSIATGLHEGMSWTEILTAALAVSTSAGGLFSLVGRYFLKSKES